MNIGNKLVTVPSHGLRNAVARDRHIARHRLHRFTGQELPQLRVAVPGKEAAQIFTVFSVG
jgi:hypothetical protein